MQLLIAFTLFVFLSFFCLVVSFAVHFFLFWLQKSFLLFVCLCFSLDRLLVHCSLISLPFFLFVWTKNKCLTNIEWCMSLVVLSLYHIHSGWTDFRTFFIFFLQILFNWFESMFCFHMTRLSHVINSQIVLMIQWSQTNCVMIFQFQLLSTKNVKYEIRTIKNRK